MCACARWARFANASLPPPRYQKFVFGLDKVIVPMCLSVWNPWPFEHYTLSSGAAQHLCWYLFSPGIIMKHALLEPQKRRASEKPQGAS
jgi:hypothetical protein